MMAAACSGMKGLEEAARWLYLGKHGCNNERMLIAAWNLSATSAGAIGTAKGNEAELKSCAVEFFFIFRAIFVGGSGFGTQMRGGSGSRGA